jgi:glycosyltransferase involved in cell wall biosynthesis
MKDGKELWLFTMSFPFGNGEAFLENELPVLAQGFERVRLFPLMVKGDPRPLPANVETVTLLDEDQLYQPLPLWRLLLDLPRFLRIWTITQRSTPSRAVFKARRREALSVIRCAFTRERILRRYMGAFHRLEDTVLYSYWASDWATVLGLWKLRDDRVHFSARMHGFDLFAERSILGWPMLQAFHIRQTDCLFVVSQAGVDDLLQRYPRHRADIRLSRLGTTDHGVGPWSPAAGLRIASCANLIPLKRVELLAEALRQVPGPVHWTHFGEGSERARLEAVIASLPVQVHVDLRGSVPNSEIMAWYRSNPVDAFVHTSRTEGGAPVALQEAASFGIPLIAADAGGVREIATPETGILLPNAITPKMLAEVLNGFRTSGWYDAEARSGVRSFWASKFNAKDAYNELLDELHNG